MFTWNPTVRSFPTRSFFYFRLWDVKLSREALWCTIQVEVDYFKFLKGHHELVFNIPLVYCTSIDLSASPKLSIGFLTGVQYMYKAELNGICSIAASHKLYGFVTLREVT